jgi:phage gp46-like protein
MSLDKYGSDIVFVGGTPTMHKGLTNAVLISLFTMPGWVGAKLVGCEGLLGSEFQNACSASLTVSSMNRIRQAAEKALSWVVGTVEVRVSNPTGSRLTVIAVISPPGNSREKTVSFILSKEGLHWYYQLLGDE